MFDMFNLIFIFGYLITLCTTAPIRRINQCKYTSQCVNVNDTFSIEINFHTLPTKVMNGYLISNYNSSVYFQSEPVITKNKQGVVYSFTPSLIGKYHFKFNHNLNCPEVITVKTPFNVNKMPHTLFISEYQLSKALNVSIDIELNTTLHSHEDISSIHFVEHIKGFGEEENKYEEIQSYKLINNNNKTYIQLLLSRTEGLNTKVFGLYYKDMCNIMNTLGFVNIISPNIDIKKPHLSLLTQLKGYNMKNYNKNRETIIIILISFDKSNHVDFLYKHVGSVANVNSNYTFVYADWKSDSYLATGYQIKDEGFIKVIIHQFSTDNIYISDIKEGEEFVDVINKLNNDILKWTSMSLSQKLLRLLNMKMDRDETGRIYFTGSCIGFVFLIVLRCYLFEKKRRKMEAQAQFAYNTKKTKVE